MNMQERAAAIAANPHNLGANRLCNFDYWAAQFEREGRNARPGADCPYNPGTMAAMRWQAGQHFRYGERQFSRGYPAPIGDDWRLDAQRQGWQSCRAYYLESIERGSLA